jgi:hypothetical protein
MTGVIDATPAGVLTPSARKKVEKDKEVETKYRNT